MTLNFYDVQEWTKKKYKINLHDGSSEEVKGEVWGSWGIHWEKDENTFRLTYIPNGKMIGIENENIWFNCEKDVLKELASKLNPYLKTGSLPSNPRPMKKAVRDFYNSL